ncbi:MAG: hypothetical protein MJE66_01220 [Proteobacteria bacterium]|nr:hypothetical protein [Pseudomonadota bacterium]
MSPPVAGRESGRDVLADAAGTELWFSSDDAPLRPAPEAFATALFVPALDARARIELDAPLDEEWLARTNELLPILREFWGYRGRHPLRGATATTAAAQRHPGVGLCFTGGVDSFYALLREPNPVDVLVYVAGYDIPLEDAVRQEAYERSLAEIADRTGKKAIVVRTNLRTHPLFARSNWERTHGAALAAVGHALSDTIGTLRIPATWPYRDPRPWGSSFRTDPLWSSRTLGVEHGDASLSRRDKIPILADEPLVRQHLRVCWENRSATGNCSECGKCLRTMVGLAACGALEACETFDRSISLEERLDALESVPRHLLLSWWTTHGRLPGGSLRDAIGRLLTRSETSTRS